MHAKFSCDCIRPILLYSDKCESCGPCSHWWLFNLPANTQQMPVLHTIYCALMPSWMGIIFHQWATARRQCNVCGSCHLLLLYSIDTTWERDSEHPCHQSAVEGYPLVGSTCLCGPVTGDFITLLCVVLLTEVIYSFVMTFNIIQVGVCIEFGRSYLEKKLYKYSITCYALKYTMKSRVTVISVLGQNGNGQNGIRTKWYG